MLKMNLNVFRGGFRIILAVIPFYILIEHCSHFVHLVLVLT